MPGGTFLMGDHHDEGYPTDGERPVHELELLTGFWIDRAPVTNTQFAQLVDAKGHITTAEEFGSSAVLNLGLRADRDEQHRLPVRQRR